MKKTEVKCAECGVTVLKRNTDIARRSLFFCSNTCRVKGMKGRPRGKQEPRACQECGVSFKHTAKHRSLKHCESCFNGTMNRKNWTLAEYRTRLAVSGKHPSWKHSLVRVLNREWNKGMTVLPCANCGYSKHVELCHRRAVSDFPDSALLGEVNSPDNVVQLCRNCHWEFDHLGLVI